MTAPYDVYRTPEARKLMLDYVMASRGIDASYAVAELRALNHVGLAYVYRDAMLRYQIHVARVDYDPCAVGRT